MNFYRSLEKRNRKVRKLSTNHGSLFVFAARCSSNRTGQTFSQLFLLNRKSCDCHKVRIYGNAEPPKWCGYTLWSLWVLCGMLCVISFDFCVSAIHRMLRYAFYNYSNCTDDNLAVCLLLTQLERKIYNFNLKGVSVTLATITFDYITMGTGKSHLKIKKYRNLESYVFRNAKKKNLYIFNLFSKLILSLANQNMYLFNLS